MRRNPNPIPFHAVLVLAVAPTALLFARGARAATYHVGPSRALKTLQEVAPNLAPGDVVEVDGGATYAGDVRLSQSGTPSAKITIRGVRAGGSRPVLAGGANTVHLAADHYVFEGFDITGGAARCVFHQGDDIIVRDSVVHDCPAHGILGADEGSGSLTLEYVEVHSAGSGDTRHPIYIATDEEAHPGSVFRMQHCYVHDGNGGNNVKSRAERNEIYYNWIEGATYHELELIGPDGADEGIAREDSDVVGNVFRKTAPTYTTRIGGDGTGQTFGRYRFVGNTFLLASGSGAVFRIFDGIESVEMHNNVFYREGGGGVEIVRDAEASWVSGVAVAGRGNWIPDGSTAVPAAWAGTLTGALPGFSDLASLDVRPAAGSALIDRGSVSPPSSPGHPFPSPLASPRYLPPVRRLEAVGAAALRPLDGHVDIGAFEFARPAGAGSAESAGSPAPTVDVSTAGWTFEGSVPAEPDRGAPSAPAPGTATEERAGCSVRGPAHRQGAEASLAVLCLVAGCVRRRRAMGRP